jgi:hypothetical protein
MAPLAIGLGQGLSLKPHGRSAGVPTGEIFGANVQGFGSHTPKIDDTHENPKPGLPDYHGS